MSPSCHEKKKSVHQVSLITNAINPKNNQIKPRILKNLVQKITYVIYKSKKTKPSTHTVFLGAHGLKICSNNLEIVT